MRAPGVGSARAGHRTLPHTADLIVEAWASTREQCLTEAVAALIQSFADTSNAISTSRHAFRLPASSDEQALVALLEEVLYLLDAHGQVPLATHLDPRTGPELSGWFDLASVSGIPLVGSTPKGIALSGLGVHLVDGAWRCTAMVDV